MSKWIFYDRCANEGRIFDSMEKAMEHAELFIQRYSEGGEGYPDSGDILIAKVTHVNTFHPSDRAKDHPCIQHPERTALCHVCDEHPECPQTDAWEHSPFDEIGEMKMDEVTE